MTERLVVLDFSGTLCLAGPRFAAPAALEEELRLCGLAALGVTPGVFWTDLVNPTWTEGGTTPTGYRRLLTARLEEILEARGLPADREDISLAVSRFSDHYFRSCHVDPLWHRFLRTCVRQAGLATVVASDHYAEATEAIVTSLAGLTLPVRSLAGTAPPRTENILWVANSADLGSFKSSRAFWDAVRRFLNGRDWRGIFLVDDFGSNEPAGDAYGEAEKVERRRVETAARLEEVFQAPVTCHPFTLRPAAGPEGIAAPGENPVAARIALAVEALERFLAA